MAPSVKTVALDGHGSPLSTRPLRLRYQVRRATREIFWRARDGFDDWDMLAASAAYMAVHDGEHLTPEFIGSCTKKANDYTVDPGLLSMKLALEHALKTVHRILQDDPAGFKFGLRVLIYSDNLKGLQLLRRAVDCESLEYFRTLSGKPKPYPAVLAETFIVHQKIEHMVGLGRVKFYYKFPGGNTRPFFDQKIVAAKCNEILDQMQEEYYASSRWNQVSLFRLSFDCNKWLKGYCDLGSKCRYAHRMKKLGTGIPPRPQKDTGDQTALARKVNCKFWAQGKCFNGDACTFAHEGDGGVLERPVCIYWKQGECFNGDSCGFLHEDIKPDTKVECSEVDFYARLKNVEIGEGEGEGEGESGFDEESE